MAFTVGDKVIVIHSFRQQQALVGTLENIDTSTGATIYSVAAFGPQGEVINALSGPGRMWAIADGAAPTPIKPIVGQGDNSTHAVTYASNRPEI